MGMPKSFKATKKRPSFDFQLPDRDFLAVVWQRELKSCPPAWLYDCTSVECSKASGETSWISVEKSVELSETLWQEVETKFNLETCHWLLLGWNCAVRTARSSQHSVSCYGKDVGRRPLVAAVWRAGMDKLSITLGSHHPKLARLQHTTFKSSEIESATWTFKCLLGLLYIFFKQVPVESCWHHFILFETNCRQFWEDVEVIGLFTLTPLYSGAGSPRCQVLPGAFLAAAAKAAPCLYNFMVFILEPWDACLVDFQQKYATMTIRVSFCAAAIDWNNSENYVI